jgi:tetratricopeptide (TPR) repeat protein
MLRAWLVLVLTLMFGVSSLADERKDIQTLTNELDEQWAEAFYNAPDDQKASRLESLLIRARDFGSSHPQRAEPLILEAIMLCSLAGVDWGLDSLSRIEQARALLIKAIDFDPKAMDAAAYITLGNLYFRLPGWPLSFGDERQARRYLEAALVLFPDAIDANYFMGNFLLDQGQYPEALPFLEKAQRAPIRPYQRVSDAKLKQQLPGLLRSARSGGGGADFFSSLLPDFGSR